MKITLIGAVPGTLLDETIAAYAKLDTAAGVGGLLTQHASTSGVLTNPRPNQLRLVTENADFDINIDSGEIVGTLTESGIEGFKEAQEEFVPGDPGGFGAMLSQLLGGLDDQALQQQAEKIEGEKELAEVRL